MQSLIPSGATIATVDIPKDMVVSSGKVVVNPEGQNEGTYLELTLSNATSDKVYINVGKLVDIYTAKANATQVQIAIDSATREVSATIVAGGVGSTELADGAVITAKIGDAQVTKAKLGTDVQASIDKADSAIQSVATGKTDGTVAVDGTDVLVAGLKSAAYAETTAFDAAGVADTKVKGILKRWTWELVDEEKVPKAFCTSDSKKINAAIKEGIRDIAGIRIFEESTVR